MKRRQKYNRKRRSRNGSHGRSTRAGSYSKMLMKRGVKRRKATRTAWAKKRSYRKSMRRRNPEAGDVVIARWETTGNDWIELIRHEFARGSGYTYRGKGMGGMLGEISNDRDALAWMTAPWGKHGAGPVTVLKTDRPSLRRVHNNPALRPFAGAKGRIQYPSFNVLGRVFDDLATAKAFADMKAEESNKPVDVMSKPDSWTMAFEAYVAYPSSMSKAERKEFHDQRWHPSATANPRKKLTTAQKTLLKHIRWDAERAAKLRKKGDIQHAMDIELAVSSKIRQLERQGLADEAFEAEMRGQERVM